MAFTVEISAKCSTHIQYPTHVQECDKNETVLALRLVPSGASATAEAVTTGIILSLLVESSTVLENDGGRA